VGTRAAGRGVPDRRLRPAGIGRSSQPAVGYDPDGLYKSVFDGFMQAAAADRYAYQTGFPVYGGDN
jgi:hypothetical protein